LLWPWFTSVQFVTAAIVTSLAAKKRGSGPGLTNGYKFCGARTDKFKMAVLADRLRA